MCCPVKEIQNREKKIKLCQNISFFLDMIFCIPLPSHRGIQILCNCGDRQEIELTSLLLCVNWLMSQLSRQLVGDTVFMP